MSNEVTCNESYTLYEPKLKILRLLEIIQFFGVPKMVAMETISINPDAILCYICELQFIICNMSKKYFKYLTQSIHVWVLITKMLYPKPKNVGFCPI